MTTCDLCDLPTPDSPVADEGVEGTFCCRGCLEVSRALAGDDSMADPGDGDVDDLRAALGAEADAAAEPDEATGPADPDSGETAFLAIEGMHCTSCEAFLEARASGHEGVADAQASYASGLMRLVYDPSRLDRADLPGVVDGTGYRARDPGVDATEPDDDGLGRLLVGGFFGMMVMAWYVLFLYPTYLGLPAGTRLFELSGEAGTYLLLNVWAMTTVVLGYTGYPRLRGAYVSLRAGQPNMDLLVALAAVSAYLYSVAAVLTGGAEVYFDVVVAVIVVVALGEHYESRIRRRAAGAVADVARAWAETARRKTAGGTDTVPVAELSAGDRVVVRTGERVPVDGTVASGTAAVDESLLTGEPRPRTRGPGDSAVAGAVVVDGAMVVEAGDPSERTVDRLLTHVWSVQSGRPGAQRLADAAATVFVPLVVVLAVSSVAVRLLAGGAPRLAVLAGLSVLVVSCPCALGLATPLAVARGIREALGRGAVVTGRAVFARGADVDVVALDKTGTLTTGEMGLRAVVGEGGVDQGTVLARAAAVEQFSDHPIGEAVLAAAEADGRAVAAADDFERHAGRGVSAVVDGERVAVGRVDLVEELGFAVSEDLAWRFERARREGHLPALVGWAGTARGLVVAGDEPRNGWEAVVSELAEGREVVVLTGDDAAAAAPFEAHPGVTEVFAGLPPEAKAETVARLRTRGTVAMVGDGTNDAGALAAADVGVAIERGADLAADAADVVITSDDLGAVPTVLRLVAATRRRIRWNLAWAFGYNAVAIPLALAGALNPLLAAVAMAASSLLVVGNSSRRLLSGEDRAGGVPRGDEPPPVVGAEPTE